MLTNEDYRLIGLISSERTGKSTYIHENIIKRGGYDWTKQVCVILTEGNPSCYDKITRVQSYDQLRKLKSGIVKFWDYTAKDEFAMLAEIRKLLQQGKLQNGLFVMEDAGIYLNSNTPTEVRSIVLSRRMFKIDVVAVFHSFIDYPSFMRRRTNHFIIGKNLDRMPLKKFEQLNYPNSDGLFEANERISQAENRFVKELVSTGL